MNNNEDNSSALKRNIRFLVMDVDGTLTDGKIYMGQSGEVFKAFNIKDGYGIHDMLPKLGIIPIIITGRESKIVLNRCSELGIIEIHQGRVDKMSCLLDILKKYNGRNNESNEEVNLREVAYIGDDNLDIQCIVPIKKAGGLVACPADASNKVKPLCDYVCERNGGDGAVREFIEWLEVGVCNEL